MPDVRRSPSDTLTWTASVAVGGSILLRFASAARADAIGVTEAHWLEDGFRRWREAAETGRVDVFLAATEALEELAACVLPHDATVTRH